MVEPAQPDDGRQPIALWIPQAISLAHLTFTHKWSSSSNLGLRIEKQL